MVCRVPLFFSSSRRTKFPVLFLLLRLRSSPLLSSPLLFPPRSQRPGEIDLLTAALGPFVSTLDALEVEIHSLEGRLLFEDGLSGPAVCTLDVRGPGEGGIVLHVAKDEGALLDRVADDHARNARVVGLFLVAGGSGEKKEGGEERKGKVGRGGGCFHGCLGKGYTSTGRDYHISRTYRQ